LRKKASTLSTPIASLKFPPIIAVSHSTRRAKDWDDIVTAHSDESFARSWSLLNKKHGKHSFKFDTDEKRKGPPVGSVKVFDPAHDLILHSDE
jgi:U3 small nucleolar RNA-associated protein 21